MIHPSSDKTESKNNRVSRVKQWLKRSAFLFLGIVLLAAATGLIVVHSRGFRNFLLRELDRRLRQQSGMTLTVDQFRLRPLALRVEMDGARLLALSESSGSLRKAGVDRIELDLGASTLLGRRLHLRSLRILRPRIELSSPVSPETAAEAGSPQGSGPDALSPSSQAFSLRWRIDRFHLEGGEIAFGDSVKSLEAALLGIRAEMEFPPGASTHIGRIRSGPGEIRYAGRAVTLSGLNADFELGDEEIQFKTLTFESDILDLSLKGRVRSFLDFPRVDIQTEGTAHLSALETMREGDPLFSGELHFNGTLRGPANDPKGEVTLNGRSLLLSGFSLDSIHAELVGDSSGLEITDLNLAGAGGGLSARGRIISGEEVCASASLEWRSLDLQRLTTLLGMPPSGISARSDGNISADIRGWRLDTLTGKGQAVFHPLEGTTPDLSGRLDCVAGEGRLSLDTSDLKLEGHRLSLSAEADLEGIRRARFHFESDDLSRLPLQIKTILGPKAAASFIPASGMGGQISMEGSLSGGWRQTSVNLDLIGRNLRFGETAVDAAEGRVRMDGNGVEITRLELRFPRGMLTVGGRVSHDSARRIWGETVAVSAEARDIDLAPLAATWFPESEVRGRLDATFEGSGSFKSPDASFLVEISDGAFAGENIDSLIINGGFDGKTLEVRRLEAAKGKGRLAGEMSLEAAARTYRIRLKAEDLDLESLKVLQASGLQTRGRLGVSLAGEGSWDAPRFRLDAEGRSLGLNQAEWPLIRLEAEADGAEARVRLHLPDRQADLDVRISLSGTRIIDGRLSTEALDVLSWIPVHDASPSSAALTSTLEFSLPAKDWKQGRFVWNISEAVVRHQDLSLQTKGPWRLEWENQELRVQDFKLEGPAFELTASGFIPFDLPSTSGIRIRGTGELSRLAFLLPGLYPEGLLKIEGAVGGCLTRPDFEGTIELENGRLKSADTPLSIENAGLKAVLRHDAVELERLAFETAGGTVSGSGRIPIAVILPGREETVELPEIEARLRLNGLDPTGWLPLPESEAASSLHSEINGEFHIGGRIDSLKTLSMEGVFSRIAVFSAGLKLENPHEVTVRLHEGRLKIDSLELEGGGSDLKLQADIGLSPTDTFTAELTSGIDTAIFNPMLEAMTIGGRLELAVEGHGTRDAPRISGRGGVSRGYLELKDFPLTVTEISGPLEITPGRVTASGWTGIGNGGAIDLNGELIHESFRIRSAGVDLGAAGVQISTPEGLQGVIGGRFGFRGDGREWRLSGAARVERGFFGKAVYPGGELFGLIGRSPAPAAEIPPIVRDIRLDIQMETVDPLVIDNNLAELEMAGNLRVTGTVGRPLLTGGFNNRSIGGIVFGERSFEVETAAIDYSETPPLEGRLNLTAHTQMKHRYDDLDVTLHLSGPLTRLEYDLSSVPPRSQGELASLLITGFGTEKLKSETANVIGSQMIVYFTSPLASPVTDRIRRWLGAEEVSFEPINIASEENPGARFTFRKGLIRNVDLVYSIDVANSQDQAWRLEYNLSRYLSLSTFRHDDGSFGGSFSSRFSLGGPPKTGPGGRSSPARRDLIRRIEFTGAGAVPLAELKKNTRMLRRGKPFSYPELRRGADRIEALYKRSGYLDMVITPRVARPGGRAADITFEIEPGLRSSILIVGDPVERKLTAELIDTWNGRLPAGISLQAAGRRIRNHLIGQGYYTAEVESRSETPGEGEIVYVFKVRRGPEYRLRSFQMPEDSPVTEDDVRLALKRIPTQDGRGLWLLLTRFSQAKALIAEILSRKGYRSAEIGRPNVLIDPDTTDLDLFLPLKPGPISRIASVDFTDPSPLAESVLSDGLLLSRGSVFNPDFLMDDRNRLDRLYRSMGYQNVRVTPDLLEVPESADLSLVYRIETGERHHVARILFSGNRHTPEWVIRRELLFMEGDPLNMEKLILSQKRLYQLAVFRSVSIRRDPSDTGETQATVLVELEEAPPLTIGYGLRYNSEEKLEGFGQLDINNLFGRGGKGLFYYRQNQRQKDLRLSFKSPYLLGRKLETLHTLSYLEEIESVYKSEETGYTIQQKVELPLSFSLSYLYRLSRIHTYELESFGPFPFDITVFLSELQVYLLRDTRDDKLNARSGSFHSLSLTYSPAFLGSDLTFISFFGQSSLFFHLGRGWVWASSLRLGLADAFDQVLIPSRRFFTGGGNSLRGFQRDMVGPYDEFFQQPMGGEALFLINQELRFPVWRWLGGVVFFDCGNVYAELSDFKPLELRCAAGGGIRINAPFALIRVDYGRNLNPLPWEKGGVWFFSLGQSF